MKLLTLNTHSLIEKNPSLKAKILAETILKEKIDVAAFQEVNQSISAEGIICSDIEGEIKKDNSEIKAYYTKLDNDIDTCIQKIGLVRYNAFKDVGSDLSFAIAMLDRNDNGVILNGLYGSESSNIYAKPVKNGISKYQLSEEEKTALEIAEQSKNFIAKNRK